MTGILKVDQWKDSGDNTLMTSDGAGNLTANVSIGGFSSTGIDDNATSTAVTINSSEQVIIGGTTPENSSVVLEAQGALNPIIQVTDTTNNIRCGIQAGDSSAVIRCPQNYPLVFGVGSGEQERMRIESDGTIQLATSTQGISNYKTNPGNWVSNITDGAEDFRVGTLVTSADASVIHIVNKTATGSGNFMAFRIQGSTKGTISTDGSNTSYNSISDYRLKENVVDVVDAITRVKQLQPKRFNFIEQPNKTVDGFLAHEVSEVVPEAITGTKDEIETYTDLEGNEQTRPVYQNIDQSKLVPLLTASLKEAIAKIEELETRIATLENA